MWKFCALALLIGGCTHFPTTIDELVAGGFTKSTGTPVLRAFAGEKEPDFDLWMKMTEAGQMRTVSFCYAPRKDVQYNWQITVTIDREEVWSYMSAPLNDRHARKRYGIDCATSPPLSPGKMSWLVWQSIWK